MFNLTRLGAPALGFFLILSIGLGTAALAESETTEPERSVENTPEGEAVEAVAPGPIRSEALRWTHSDPADVRSFKVRWGTRPGVYQTTLDLGKPPESAGVFAAAINVPAADTVYVALSAVGTNGLESILSNVGIRTAGGTTSGTIGTPGRPQIEP